MITIHITEFLRVFLTVFVWERVKGMIGEHRRGALGRPMCPWTCSR